MLQTRARSEIGAPPFFERIPREPYGRSAIRGLLRELMTGPVRHPGHFDGKSLAQSALKGAK